MLVDVNHRYPQAYKHHHALHLPHESLLVRDQGRSSKWSMK